MKPRYGDRRKGGLSPSRLAPGTWQTLAYLGRESRRVERRITVQPGEDGSDLDFDLRLGRWTLSGLLAGAYFPGFVVAELTTPELPGFLWQSALEQGTFTFPRLQEGSYRLRILRGRRLSAREDRQGRLVDEQGVEVLHEQSLELGSDLELQIELGGQNRRPFEPKI